MTQFTIDGGEVSHPPPPPRVYCPDCEKIISLTRRGFVHKHGDGYGQPCPGSGLRPDR